MSMENSTSDLKGNRPRSNAYAYIVHSRFPEGASVFEHDNLSDALDAICERGLAAPVTGLLDSVILFDGNVIATWCRTCEE
jgi:hypothetical protein